MYSLKPGIKGDPARFWALPDRIFFGYGACHILAGSYLACWPLPDFHAEKIIPADGYWGNHIYVTDGVVAFDFHGYSLRDNLLAHHRKRWSATFPGWDCTIEHVTFDLLSTSELNARNMRGPDQYLHMPLERAKKFISRYDHAKACRRTAGSRRSQQAPVPA